jgi:hypothetical protein
MAVGCLRIPPLRLVDFPFRRRSNKQYCYFGGQDRTAPNSLKPMRSEMAKSNDEKTYENFLDEKWKIGEMALDEKMRMMEEFRALRAQRKASTSALYAAIAAAFSAVFAAASVIISLIALSK